MKERIKTIMEQNSMSAAQFADKIGVARSGLSHVLSGRNKASLDYIVKILKEFPQIDSNWLLTGQGDVRATINGEKSTGRSELGQQVHTSLDTLNKKISTTKTALAREVLPGKDELIKESDKRKGRNTRQRDKREAKGIERIVIFYSDGSFESYCPNK